jgi:hypothetical protein
MERYLLFDGGCVLCTGLAQAIEQETQGWLTAKSLRDPAMRELLDNARPGWTWEPMLVEVRGERVRVYTGLKMRSRLVVGLGPRRAVRVAQLVQQALVPKVEVDQGRRRFLQRGAMLAGLALLGPRVAFSPSSAVAQEQSPKFILLSGNEGAALVAEARKDGTVNELTKWLAQTNTKTKGWTKKTAVPFRVIGQDSTVSAVAFVDAATSAVLVYGRGWTSAVLIPTADSSADVFGIKDGQIQQIQRDDVPQTKADYQLLHELQPTDPGNDIQPFAEPCCTLCRNCILGNAVCALAFVCCVSTAGLCCGPGLGICFTTIILCSNSLNCQCIGSCR